MNARREEQPAPILELRGFTVAFGERVVLQSIHLQMGASNLSVIGHAGAGKSTLLRTLGGLNDAQPELRVSGEAYYQGKPLGEGPRPWLVGQKARLLLSTVHENMAQALPNRDRLTSSEQRDRLGALLRDTLGSKAPSLDARVIELPLSVQRCLAIARGLASGARLLLVDEPTAGLPEDGRAMVLDVLLRVKETHSLMLVTHHLGDVRALGGDLILLVGGRAVESTPTEEFFIQPRTAAGSTFLETGTCYFVPGEEPQEPPPESASNKEAQPASEGAEAASSTPPPDESKVASKRATPASGVPSKYLHWVLPGRLLGMPRPGVVRDVDDDLSALKRLGVTVVVSLEETRTVPEAALQRYGMRSEHLAIDDMGAPGVEEAKAMCQTITDHLQSGEVVAVHCLGGAGRTGLILAAYFIAHGQSALDALEAVRKVQPRFVQSQAQVDFLSSFELYCRGTGSLHHCQPPNQ